MRASARRSADTSGGSGKPRCTPPIPPVPGSGCPTAARDRERAADGRRPDRPCDGAGGEVARAELARLGREALELVAVEADADAPVEDADRGGHRAGRADGRLALERRPRRRRARESRARRASSRARRRAAPPRARSRPRRETDEQLVSRHRPASSRLRRSGPPPRARGRARRRASPPRARRRRRSCRRRARPAAPRARRRRTSTRRAALHDPGRAREAGRRRCAPRPRSRRRRRGEPLERASRNSLGAGVADRAPGGEVDADARLRSRARARPPRAPRRATGSRSSA